MSIFRIKGRKMQTLWDYSERAATYDKRADYSEEAVASLLDSIACSTQTPVADIGAGTGSMAIILDTFRESLSYFYNVYL